MDRFLSHQSQRVKRRISFLFWSTWKIRNAVVFNNATLSMISCLIKAKRAGAEWYTQNHLSVDPFLGGYLSSPHHKRNLIVTWESPSPGMVKLNFDGSCRGPSALRGLILRD